MKRVILLFVFLGILMSGSAQNTKNEEWKTYMEGTSIDDIADAGDDLWLISDSGTKLIKFAKKSGSLEVFDYQCFNFRLNDRISNVECDNNGLPWAIGYFQGILRMTEENQWDLIPSFVEEGWMHKILVADNGVVWSTSDDILIRHNGEELDTFRANGLIMSLAKDHNGDIWMGTSNGFQLLYDGLVKFNGENLTIYNSSPTGLSPMVFLNIVFDEQGNKWMSGSLGFISLFGGNKLIRFNEAEWSVYDLPVETFINSLALQYDNVLWLGTYDGLMRFSNSQWTVFNTENSELPSNNIRSVVVDKNGTKWLATDYGLVAFKEDFTLVETDYRLNDEIFVYPNPASDFVTLKIPDKMKGVTVDIINIQGQIISSFNINKSHNQLDVSYFPAGMYLVRVQTGENQSLKKFVKQ